MPPKSPVLGSLAVQAPSLTPQIVHVSPSTCHNLSLFKELMKEYRRLDDTITMRLNRTNAQFRDRDRLGTGGKGSVQDQTCMYIWKELVENWKRRTDVIEYCVGVVDQSMEQKRQALGEKVGDPVEQRKIQGDLFADEVKRNQVHNELSVEKIVRQRSLDAFSSRCRYFEPPLTDAEARKWWDEAHSRS
ncbi:hypothetical protein HETIRDRAFT_422381 [Heterobasidion irregulare TC 32-1]|uniref:Caffeine-induced death protein 2 n=1 Tax=Heterobasidion irregulare (strain TC 32-1) TaxID=747525 RepID=W4JRK0_HETIT|nr:uncharacterized protein HETIRDRAFT_422381 [Heterobasidion irregulare TC 32-1]ETW75710.1 hypothetical protein HETIRDRAFT_422381 [Heterobasidion irregulare TC 32-1]